MRGHNQTDSFIHRYRWRLFFFSIALILAIPALIYISSPIFHALGLHDLASAGDNMAASNNSQKGAMASTAGSAAAGAAGAGSDSGHRRRQGDRPPGRDRRLKGDDVKPLDQSAKPKTTDSDDNTNDPFRKKKSGDNVKKDPPQDKSTSKSSGSKDSSGENTSWKDWFRKRF